MDSSPSTPKTGSDQEPSQTEGAGGSNRALIGAAVAALVAAFFLFAAFSGGDDGPAATDQAANPIANLTFTTEAGDAADLAVYEGQPLVVNFFASWCAPCRAEMPEFETVHLANTDAVKFLGVSHDIDEATWKGFVDETEITFETVFQPNTEIWTALDAKGMPSTVFIGPDGDVRHLYTGVLNEELLQELIDEHLTEGA